MFLIKGNGNGRSWGNWTEPSAVLYVESSFAKAFIADGMG